MELIVSSVLKYPHGLCDITFLQYLLCSPSPTTFLSHYLPPDHFIFLTSKHWNASELILVPLLFSITSLVISLNLMSLHILHMLRVQFISPDLTSSLNSKFKYLLLDISNLRFRKLNFLYYLSYLSQSPFLINGNSVLLFAHTKILESYLISQEKDLSHLTFI